VVDSGYAKHEDPRGHTLITIAHAILFCQFAREVWDAVQVVHPIKLQRKFFSPRIWALDFLDRCSRMKRTTMVVTM
jgi:hypothetical protein